LELASEVIMVLKFWAYFGNIKLIYAILRFINDAFYSRTDRLVDQPDRKRETEEIN
jgi:hypothetical protein